jgi:hypothetical protein
MHTGHTACQNVPQKAFPLKIFYRTKSGAEKLNTVVDSLKSSFISFANGIFIEPILLLQQLQDC